MAASMACMARSMSGVAARKDSIASPSADRACSNGAAIGEGVCARVDVSAKAGAAATPAAASWRRSRRQGEEVIVSCSFRFGRREGFLGRNVLLGRRRFFYPRDRRRQPGHVAELAVQILRLVPTQV